MQATPQQAQAQPTQEAQMQPQAAAAAAQGETLYSQWARGVSPQATSLTTGEAQDMHHSDGVAAPDRAGSDPGVPWFQDKRDPSLKPQAETSTKTGQRDASVCCTCLMLEAYAGILHAW